MRVCKARARIGACLKSETTQADAGIVIPDTVYFGLGLSYPHLIDKYTLSAFFLNPTR